LIADREDGELAEQLVVETVARHDIERGMQVGATAPNRPRCTDCRNSTWRPSARRPKLQVMHRVVTGHLLGQAGLMS